MENEDIHLKEATAIILSKKNLEDKPVNEAVLFFWDDNNCQGRVTQELTGPLPAEDSIVFHGVYTLYD